MRDAVFPDSPEFLEQLNDRNLPDFQAQKSGLCPGTEIRCTTKVLLVA
jgi:hypothetical protein